MERCYICSRILTELNTNKPEDEVCVNCSLTDEEFKRKLKNEIQSSKRYRERKKA